MFFSRAVKSRTLAQKVIAAGAIRVNSAKTIASDYRVGAGDVLTMALHERIVVWKILDPGVRRGPASEAQKLYEDLSPVPLPRDKSAPDGVAIGPRDMGAGRPTKKERRATDRFRVTG